MPNQTNMGPIKTPQINQTLYVGQSGYPTIQSAVTFACSTGKPFAVVIPPGATPSDTPTSVTGCANTYIVDQRTSTLVYYTWTGSAYVANPSGGGSMVYPPAGIPQSTGPAWGTSIDPTTVPRTDSNGVLHVPFYGYSPIATQQLIRVGDSLATAVTIPQRWSSVLSTLPFFLNRATLNDFSAQSQTSATITASYASQVAPLKPNGTTITKSYLLISVGVNEILNVPDTWETNIDAYMTQAKADGFYVVAMTMTPISNSLTTTTGISFYQVMNNYLRRSPIPDLVIDANQMFSNPDDPNWFQAGIQPTAAAQRNMAEAMNSIFESGTNPQNPNPVDFNNPHFATINGNLVVSYPAAGVPVSNPTASGWTPSIDPATLARYPAAGIPNSTGTAWAASINPATLATYPAAGVPLSTGTAWGASIDPATIGPVKSVNGKVGVVVLNAYDTGSVLGPVASPDSLYFNTVLGGISATFDTIQARVPIWTPTNACNFQVVFSNSLNQPETGGPPLTVRAALEYPEGVFWPLYFNGVRDAQLAGQPLSAGGGMLISDPLGMDMTAKVVGWVRYRVIRAPGSIVAIPSVKTFGATVGAACFAPNTTTAIGGKWDNLEQLITRTVNDGAMALGSAVFSSATAAFVPQDAGQNITVATAGAAGATLTTTILTFTNATTVTLAASNASGAAVSGAATTIAPADKTTSGTIYNGTTSFGYAPFAVLGQVGINLKTAGLVGDSITAGTGATVLLTGGVANIQGSWAVQSLNQAGVIAGLATREAVAIPYINSSLPGETVANLIVNHAMRFSLLSRCKFILGMIGTNDIFTLSATAATIEANLVTLWRQEVLRQGQPWYGTIVPQSTSTDVWLTLINQTVKAAEPVRVAVNTWLRDGAPVDNTTGLPVAVGTSPTTANRAAFYGVNGVLINAASGPGTHPASGLFELANTVESSQNSGKWGVDPTNRTVTDATTTTGSNTISSATANFTAADVGRVVTAPGLVAGSNIATIQSVTNSTTAVIAGSGAVTGGTNLTMTIAGTFGTYAFTDGVHPNSAGHKAMGAAAALVIAHWQ